jgi:dTDP-4-amino-4,6-dideoxygalactose transaminase
MIPFNRPTFFGKELDYITDAFQNGRISGDGKYTKLCSSIMENKFKAKKVLLTTSGTHALELAALMIDLKAGDEVIMPSYTFVSTANAVVLRGAKPIFSDIRLDNLNLDEKQLESKINDRTKAIIPVHYGGIACDMDVIMQIAKENDLFVIEDAAQGVNACYKDKYLGTIGDIGCYSFHETKNYSMGEGGAIVINDDELIEKAEIMREKGTNRSKFFRGEVDKYTWVDKGSSFLPSDINSAVLYAQLERMDEIQSRRMSIFQRYMKKLSPLEKQGKISMPIINDYSRPNYHLFYLLLESNKIRNEIMDYLRSFDIMAVFHYIPLHESPYYRSNYGNYKLANTENLSARLLRLPLYYDLKIEEVEFITNKIIDFFTEGKDG